MNMKMVSELSLGRQYKTNNQNSNKKKKVGQKKMDNQRQFCRRMNLLNIQKKKFQSSIKKQVIIKEKLFENNFNKEQNQVRDYKKWTRMEIKFSPGKQLKIFSHKIYWLKKVGKLTKKDNWKEFQKRKNQNIILKRKSLLLIRKLVNKKEN